MDNVDLNKLNVLTDKTYVTETDSWRDYDGNFYESPFNNQAAYGQRYHSKNFDKSEYPNEGHTWYEKRATTNPDMSQMRDEYGENETPYHQDFPRYSDGSKENFFTKAMGSRQEHDYNTYTTALPATSTSVPDLVETFKIGDTEVSIISVVLVIVCIVLIIGAAYYIIRKKKTGKTTVEQTVNTVTTEQMAMASTVPVDYPMPAAPVQYMRTEGGDYDEVNNYSPMSEFILGEDW